MTKKDMVKLMNEFLLGLDNFEKEERWCTRREGAQDVLVEFSRFIDLKESPDAAQQDS